jgi:hypothetical protein
MGEGRGKTISMNDEIPPVYMVSKGIKRKRPGISGRFLPSQSLSKVTLRKRNSKMFSLI